MEYSCDLILADGNLKKGVLTIDPESGKADFEEKDIQTEYIACPSFFNSHIHLGDSHLKDPPPMSLEELVGPGGYKFRHSTSDSAEQAIVSSIEIARSSGTSALADFREGGVEGLEILKSADRVGVCYPLARPSTLEEGEKLVADNYTAGLSLSSVRDHEESFIDQIRRVVKAENKIFAIHAGERDSHDVERALSLEPDLLVHMNMATRSQLKEAMDRNIPIVSCLRSNSFFDLLNLENYRMLLDYHNWLLGTDNVMLASPSLLNEMAFASYLLQNDKEVIKAAFRGFSVFDSDPDMLVFNKKKNLAYTLSPISSVVKRVKKEDIDGIFGGFELGELFNL
ncbi:MAG: amidohydrolase family protein [Archaeoglobaceae archaeon]